MKDDKGVHEQLSYAMSEDGGKSFVKQHPNPFYYAPNECISREFRDPKVFKDKEDYTQYTDRYTAAYSEKSDLIRGGGFKIYTSLDSQLQDQLQTQIDQSLSGFTELQDNGKFALQAPVLL